MNVLFKDDIKNSFILFILNVNYKVITRPGRNLLYLYTSLCIKAIASPLAGRLLRNFSVDILRMCVRGLREFCKWEDFFGERGGKLVGCGRNCRVGIIWMTTHLKQKEIHQINEDGII